MKKISCLIILFFSYFFSAFSQAKINDSVYNSENKEVRKVIGIWQKFLNGFVTAKDFLNPLGLPSVSTIQEYQNQEFLEEYKPTIISVSNINDSTYLVKTIFSSVDDDGFIFPHSIITVPIILNTESGHIYEPFLFNLRYWKKYTKAGITFFAKPNYQFIENQIDSTINFSKKMSDLFQTPLIEFSYIVFDDKVDMRKQQGYDFHSTKRNTAMAIGDEYIFAGTNSLYDPHEIVHLYVNKKMNEDKNFWFNEGLASFLGNHRGTVLKHHYLKTLNLINSNPNIHLSKLLAYKNIDDYSDFRYVIGGLFCQIIYERDGMAGIYKLLNTPNNEVAIYNAIKNNFGLSEENLHEFIIEKLIYYSKL